MTAALLLIGIFGLTTIVALGTLYVDSSARARAWRRIADERRWNEERSNQEHRNHEHRNHEHSRIRP
jgi:hypothetical protein